MGSDPCMSGVRPLHVRCDEIHIIRNGKQVSARANARILMLFWCCSESGNVVNSICRPKNSNLEMEMDTITDNIT